MKKFSRRDFFKMAGVAAAGTLVSKFDIPAKVAEAAEVNFVGGGDLVEQVYNPYLPYNAYIPDGEPHVFGDRIYVYGSHDAMGATAYCPGHYEVWSAPINNLHDWRCEGTSYLRSQDPTNAKDFLQLWAPDVVQGADGRYYLYYCFSFYPQVGVAVSNNPAGPFEYYGHVKYPANINGGKDLAEFFPFDPAVFRDDDGKVYLYYGFAPAAEKAMPERFTPEMLEGANLSPEFRQVILDARFTGEYGMVVELESDMVTMKYTPKNLIPGGKHTDGTGFEGHGYFEAPSMRKINGKYYFVYSSHKSHELCYATSNYPDRDFKYGGIIISNGDIGLNGRTQPVYSLSNNHGGIAQIGNDFYIFYHKATDGNEYSRQGSAEKIEIKSDGSIPQVEITSCGLNGAPLVSSGSYPAYIACHLTDPTVINKIDYNDPIMKTQIRVTEQMNHKFVTDIKDKSIVGYKYFDFKDVSKISVELRGNFKGTIEVTQSLDGATIGSQKLNMSSNSWGMIDIPVSPKSGKNALYFKFSGNGKADFKTFVFGR